MSFQVILPYDVTLRKVLAFDRSDTIPIKYRVKANKATPKYDMLISNQPFKDLIKRDLIAANKVISCKDFNIAKSKFDANHQTWCLIGSLLSKGFVTDNKCTDNNVAKDFVEAETISVERLGNWFTLNDKQEVRAHMSRMAPTYVQLESFALMLERLRDSYNGHINNKLKEWKREGAFDNFVVSDIYSPKKKLKYHQIGGIVYFSILDKNGNTTEYLLSPIHYRRVIEYIRNLSILSLALPHIHGIDPSASTILKIANKMVDIGKKSPNGVGGVFKAARQLLFTKGDKSKVMGKSSSTLYLNGLDGDKGKYAEYIADFLEDLTDDRKSAINLANIFKMVIHPDSDMPRVFDSIKGFHDPNTVVKKNLTRFEGIVRKTCYESLTQQRKEVRALPKDPVDGVAVKFASAINATHVPVANLLKAGYVKWSAIEFAPVRGLFDTDNQDIPVQNKSSGPSVKLTIDQLRIISDKDYKNVEEYQGLFKKLKAVNDIVQTLKGDSDLDFKSARIRFRNVIALHRQFESKYTGIGKDIEDISSEDLAEFVKNNPDASYTVGTEPKLGEVHKEVTRMFYMAEQALKIMTQVCERFVKKVISKASGISITKSYKMRRKEIEAMLDAYTGFTFIEDADDDMKVVYISFDMTEFSKKFPNALARIIGKILGELSGEDWMSRVDLFFRAAIVYHTSRGFVDYTTGVRGGFEGFLNFLWTLAMKVVMDIATQSTGVTGVLAVYSDDGLLRLYINGSLDEVREKVVKIQKVFSNFGLIFHMDKTIASTEVLEYLGIFGERGMIIPTWVKELTSIGKRNNNPGIETVSDKVMLWSSQCNALVSANGPFELATLIQNVLTLSTLRRLNTRISSKNLAALTLIPYSAGGFRTPSITESALLSKINSLTEFCADIEVMYDAYPSHVNAIIHRVVDNLKDPKDAEKSLLTGSLLQTGLCDTSGLGVVRNLIESSSIDEKYAQDPITNKRRESILSSLRNARNIDIKVVQKFIQAVPDVINYNKSIAIMKSSAALMFVDRKRIAKAQWTDTRRCKRSISEWNDYFTMNRDIDVRYKSSNLSKGIIDKLYPDYHFALLCDSPRAALTQTKVDAHILSSFEPTVNASLTKQEYREPIAKFLGAQLTPEITAESSANTKQREIERYITIAARLVSTNVSYLFVYNVIANTFRLPCPSVPSGYVVSSHRSSKNFGENAVSAKLPAPYHALVSSKMSNRMFSEMNILGRVDRTTYVESSRMACYIKFKYRDIDKYSLKADITTCGFIIRDLADNCANPTFDGQCPPDCDLVSDRVTGTFTDLLIEENAQARSADDITFTANISEALMDNSTVKAILLTRLEKWLYASIKGSVVGGTSHCPTEIPIAWKSEVMTEAVCSTSFKMVIPYVKVSIIRNLSQFIAASAGMSTSQSLENVRLSDMLTIAIQSCGDNWDQLGNQITRIGTSLSLTEMDARHKEELSSLSMNQVNVKVAIINVLKRLSVTGGTTAPTVVINTDSFADTRMSRVVRNSIRDAVDSLYQNYISRLSSDMDDNDKRVLDCNANFIFILKNMLRPSGHRGTPFNKHMVMIQLIKFELFIQMKRERGERRLEIDELGDFRVPVVLCERICRMSAVIDGRISNTSGEDMRECLFNQGIPNWAFSRLKMIIVKIRDSYRLSSITYDNIEQDNLFMHDLMNYVTNTYNNTVKDTVTNLDIRHNREAQVVSGLTTLSPVEEASMIYADINTGLLLIHEVPILDRLRSNSYKKLLINLISTHYARWGIGGYSAEGLIGRVVRQIGLIGGSELKIRNVQDSAFNSKFTTSDFTLSLSSYIFEDSAVHNYLYVNRLPNGMAVLAEDKDTGEFLLMSIIPVGVEILNTGCVEFPDYPDGFDQSPIIYEVEQAAMNLSEVARVMNVQEMLSTNSGEMASIVIQQAYQRIIGARAQVIDDDSFLVAMAELVRGAWSSDTGHRAAAMFGAWFSSGGRPNRVDLAHSVNLMARLHTHPNNEVRVALASSVSAIWEWLQLMNIQQGPNIDSGRVASILSTIGRGVRDGGAPSVIHSLPPRSISDVTADFANFGIDDIFSRAAQILYRVPIVPNDGGIVANFGLFDFGEGDF